MIFNTNEMPTVDINIEEGNPPNVADAWRTTTAA
jgi:hypothetical protein